MLSNNSELKTARKCTNDNLCGQNFGKISWCSVSISSFLHFLTVHNNLGVARIADHYQVILAVKPNCTEYWSYTYTMFHESELVLICP